MTTDAVFWLFLTLFWTLVMSFYSTQEMAAISFNKLRLEYYVFQKKRWAIRLKELLDHPTMLFTTTLAGVNLAVMASSESARRLYEALGLNPNFSSVTQIPFILIFGELAPMFAARLHPEHTCRYGSTLLYWSAKLTLPLSKTVQYFFQKAQNLGKTVSTKEVAPFLSREELQKLIEEQETPLGTSHSDMTVSNIFSLKGKQAYLLMTRIEALTTLPSYATLQMARDLFRTKDCDFIAVFHKTAPKIAGVVTPQDLLKGSPDDKVIDFVQPPLFIAEDSYALSLLSKLLQMNTSYAVVLNTKGEALGIISLDTLYEEILQLPIQEAPEEKRFAFIEKTFSADTLIEDINEAYDLQIDPKGCKTIAELLELELGRHPIPGDEITFESAEILVKETSLFKAKTVVLRSRLR